jgi:isopropylmalate/homocitrate/citramalate synthase
VIEMALAIAEAGPVEIALADTIGVANPAHVARLVERVREAVRRFQSVSTFTTPATPASPMSGRQ